MGKQMSISEHEGEQCCSSHLSPWAQERSMLFQSALGMSLIYSMLMTIQCDVPVEKEKKCEF